MIMSVVGVLIANQIIQTEKGAPFLDQTAQFFSKNFCLYTHNNNLTGYFQLLQSNVAFMDAF